MTRRRILVVDDEVKMQRILEIMLQDMGHEVLRAGNGREALAVIEHEPVDLILTDLRMPQMDGVALLRALNERGQNIPTIVITAHGTVQTAVDAMKHGACDYILRPFEVETVEIAVTRALSLSQVQRENRYLRNELERDWQEFVGRSAGMRQLYRLIQQVGPTTSPVLVVGETGTGKELAARAIHRASARTGLFVPINCAAIPASILESELFGHVKGAFTGAHKERVGKFEMADGGTLFLDEITEMPAELQAKLLRVLQESYIERLGSNRRIDIDLRVIAATNREPAAAVAEGHLREDLYYRLNVFRVTVPALRERREDIPPLAAHFLAGFARQMGRKVPTIPEQSMQRMQEYSWPGNVRELQNVMERVLVLSTGQSIDAELLSEALPGSTQSQRMPESSPNEDLSLQSRVETLERELITKALEAADGNKARAARLLDISERSLWYKLKKYALS